MAKKQPKHAVVLSGGGAYGAYEVGVLKALLSGHSPTTGFKPFEPDIITGTSVGAFNGTFLTSRLTTRGAAATDDLENLWRHQIAQGPGQCDNGIFRIRLDPKNFVSPACFMPNPLKPFIETTQDTIFLAAQTFARTLSFFHSVGPPVERAIDELYLGAIFDTEPFDQLIRDSIDFDAVRRSDTALEIFATNWSTSECRRFTNADLTNDLADRAVQASASLPTIFPPVEINEEFFVDGGLVINSPISPAIDAGADIIHVIFLDPLVCNIPMRVPIATTAEIYRSLSIIFAAQVRSQVVQIDLINRALQMLTRAEDEPQSIDEVEQTAFLRVAALVRRSIEKKCPYRPLEIHVYRPSPESLRGLLGFLDFDLANIDSLIQAGYTDAINHPARPETCESSFLEDFL